MMTFFVRSGGFACFQLVNWHSTVFNSWIYTWAEQSSVHLLLWNLLSKQQCTELKCFRYISMCLSSLYDLTMGLIRETKLQKSILFTLYINYANCTQFIHHVYTVIGLLTRFLLLYSCILYFASSLITVSWTTGLIINLFVIQLKM